MANRVREKPEKLDKILYFAWDDWESLPGLEEEFDSLHELDQQEYLVDEFISREKELDRLARAYQFGEMNPEQEQKYQALLKLVEKNRPILERIYAG